MSASLDLTSRFFDLGFLLTSFDSEAAPIGLDFPPGEFYRWDPEGLGAARFEQECEERRAGFPLLLA
jgi:hypothetical protein